MTEDTSTEVIRQDLRKFTVQIRDARTDEVIGTGIVVSTSGLVITCAHVVEAAGIDVRGDRNSVVGVYFPARFGRRAETRRATIRFAFTTSDDDLVCVQVDGPLPLASDQVAVLGAAQGSRLHPFESYGYRRLERYIGGRAGGRILGDVDPPYDCELLQDPVQLESSQISMGMSGSAVLDLERNLVVGIVSEAWFTDQSGKDRDTAWAVNAKVISLTGLDISIRGSALPLVKAKRPRHDPELVRESVPLPGHRLDDAPNTLVEWVGREDGLGLLGQEWRHGRHLVVGLIGFGGEGKSSLARRWLDTILNEPEEEGLAGVFWWSFTERADADEFLSAALEFMSAGRIAVGELPGGSARAAFAASLLSMHRYVFVLDGFELMQHQQGDQYGAIESASLREFLGYFATPGHRSFCVVTSRAPLVDLAPYVTYRHVDVTALSIESGRKLLRNLGVVGSDAALDRVVRIWGGHALTLCLLAAYLVKNYQGDVRSIDELPPPDPTADRDQLVRQILREYDASLNHTEREFLIRFSLFRTPVAEEAIEIVTGDAMGPEFERTRAITLKHLLAARVIRRDVSDRLSIHPLIRDFYTHRVRTDPDRLTRLHAKIAEYYFADAGNLPDRPRLDDLLPFIEAVHHLTRAGKHDRACDTVYDRLYVADRGLITRELNAYETVLSVFLDFFPDHHLWEDPVVDDAGSKNWILHETATALQLLGRMRDAAVVTRRAMQLFKEDEKWHDAAVSCQNMTELYFALGSLPACAGLVREAFDLASRAEDKEDELVAETLRGTLAHLEGRTDVAEEAFAAALRIATEYTPLPVLYSTSGVRYAEHLRRSGRTGPARDATEANLKVCRAAGWRADEARCHVALGDLALDDGRPDGAFAEYDRAVRMARDFTRRDVLINALTARGRWAVTTERPEVAQADLGDALTMSLLGGYRLAEIDARIDLARLHHRWGEARMAWEEATRAEQMSIEVGYHWGRVDSEALVRRLRS